MLSKDNFYVTLHSNIYIYEKNVMITLQIIGLKNHLVHILKTDTQQTLTQLTFIIFSC